MMTTERLILRDWRKEDIASFHAMGQDAEVMRYIGAPMSIADAVATVERQNGLLASHGFCFWAVERKADGAFIGFCGVKPGATGTPIADDIEIGWRLRRDAWGLGFAREAAAASIDWAWKNIDVPEIAAITVPANTRSWGLMERLGMTRDPACDFDHPAVPDGSPLKRHLTYRIARPIVRPAAS